MKIFLPHKTTFAVVVLFLVICPLFLAQAANLQLTTTSEYSSFVHIGSGCTQVDKPIFPVCINSSQVAVGKNWTITCPLQAGHNYHVYCYGAWVNTSSAAKTDYDIYVYNPSGNLESSHTEAAGLPEHLGTTSNDALFTPEQSGNYSFVIKNDERESKGAQQASFMVIENLECDRWYSSQAEGKVSGNESGFYTSWAYEFLTNASKLELYVNVPGSLDMYEARLYLMNNAKSVSINSFPLPWEAGLYGNVSSGVGGYNFENEAYRGVAYASCEHSGQDMFLNYSSSAKGLKLYHLVLIGEEGSGNVEFMLKTQFGKTSLTALSTQKHVLPQSSQTISYSANIASLESAQLSYTTNKWNTTSTLTMDISNRTCNVTIPGQSAGSFVQYKIDANDTLKNSYTAKGNYTVKAQPKLQLTIEENTVTLGKNVTVLGYLEPSFNDSTVEVQFLGVNASETVICKVFGDGSFKGSFAPSASGNWSVVASAPETGKAWRCDSDQFLLTVNEPPFYVKYSLYIMIGLVVALAVGGVVYYLKFRGS
ncbi:MAG: hypothetical protein NWE93_02640 [Candidatus Bathyarchaeota archaeon]|nr:hypothetical protein [Candidatus Bathyarchaeota archaeon]